MASEPARLTAVALTEQARHTIQARARFVADLMRPRVVAGTLASADGAALWLAAEDVPALLVALAQAEEARDELRARLTTSQQANGEVAFLWAQQQDRLRAASNLATAVRAWKASDRAVEDAERQRARAEIDVEVALAEYEQAQQHAEAQDGE